MEQILSRGRGNPNWRPGVSGNPGGRRGVPKDVRDLAKKHTKAAIATLARIMDGADERAAAFAADKLLCRGWGAPVQPVQGELHVMHSIAAGILEARERLRLARGQTVTIEHDP